MHGCCRGWAIHDANRDDQLATHGLQVLGQRLDAQVSIAGQHLADCATRPAQAPCQFSLADSRGFHPLIQGMKHVSAKPCRRKGRSSPMHRLDDRAKAHPEASSHSCSQSRASRVYLSMRGWHSCRLTRVPRHADATTGDDMPVLRLAWTTVTPCEKQGRARRDPRLE